MQWSTAYKSWCHECWQVSAASMRSQPPHQPGCPYENTAVARKPSSGQTRQTAHYGWIWPTFLSDDPSRSRSCQPPSMGHVQQFLQETRHKRRHHRHNCTTWKPLNSAVCISIHTALFNGFQVVHFFSPFMFHTAFILFHSFISTLYLYRLHTVNCIHPWITREATIIPRTGAAYGCMDAGTRVHVGNHGLQPRLNAGPSLWHTEPLELQVCGCGIT